MQDTRIISKGDLFETVALPEKNYFLSLMNAALQLGVITDDEAKSVETGISLVLKGRIEAFTRGESSSVSSSVAKKLAESVVFSLGLSMKSFSSRRAAISELLVSVEKAFEKGQEIISSRLSYAKLLYKKIAKNLFKTENVFWNVTLKGINGFFGFYTPSLFAAEKHIVADYPVFFGYPNSLGVEFICDYLRAIYNENAFLNRFSLQKAEELLNLREGEYKRSPINLFEPLLTAAVCAAISGEPARELTGREEQVSALLENENCLSEFLSFVETALNELDLHGETRDYALKAIPQVVLRLKTAKSAGVLNRYFLSKETKRTEYITLSYGGRMSDGEYNALIERVNAATRADKTEIILKNVGSLSDLFEILADADLSESEYADLLSKMPLNAVAALNCRFSSAEFSDNEKEKAVYNAIKEYSRALTPENRAEFDELCEKIRFEPLC
mgnify:CR=1 FL=1